jgi:hypothetical protein
MRVRTAILALLVLALAGCASRVFPGGDPPRPPYVGVFTGQFVDGLPLYRLPTIDVIGSRR